MKRSIKLTILVGLVAPALMFGSDQVAINRWRANNPGKELPYSLQQAQNRLNSRKPVASAYPASKRKTYQTQTEQRAVNKVQREKDELFRRESRAARLAEKKDSIKAYGPRQTTEDYEIFKAQDDAAYKQLPARSWKDYFTQEEGGFRTDASNVPSYWQRFKNWAGSGASAVGSYVPSMESVKTASGKAWSKAPSFRRAPAAAPVMTPADTDYYIYEQNR